VARRVVVIGGGVGGLVAALELACAGLDVTLLERAATPGGKLREVAVAGRRLDAGPTVFTMRWVFEEVFADAGAALSDHLSLRPASILARHAWTAGQQLDLFADLEESADAIGHFAGAAEARGFRAFSAEATRIYATLEKPFIRGGRPSMGSLLRDAGAVALWGIRPFDTLWKALSQHFADPRLRQLFGRYATYCGSSPFLAPATLMLVAHVERDGVWLVDGGMHGIAQALAGLAAARGATLRFGAEAAEVLLERGRVAGVRLADGERVAAEAVVVNADAGAVAAGLLGTAVRGAAPAVAARDRSLSAVTWATVARSEGFPLSRHNVFFSGDYAAEFRDLAAGRLPQEPTVYVCAQDRGDDDALLSGPERLLCLVNAPSTGDARPPTPTEIERCADRSFRLLARCGLTLWPEATEVTTPAGFHQLFPGTGGALYGPAVHGATATFKRPGARTRVPGLYLAGGSTHPGAGVPMAALSGRLAAASLLADLDTKIGEKTAWTSTARSPAAATPGGTSMR
jgi:1-hydroxycarotenoid 3,4-desaturase